MVCLLHHETFSQEKVNKGAAGSGFKINATIEDEGDEDDDDDEEDYDGCEETSLEVREEANNIMI